MLKTGDSAPRLTLTDSTGVPTDLGSLYDRAPTIVFFYPADFTPVCTAQACMFRDVYAELAAMGVQVVGISPQGFESKAKFKAKHELPYPLLVDADGAARRGFGAVGLFGIAALGGVRRATFFVEKGGRIGDVVASDLRVTPHERFVRRVLDAVKGQ